MSTFEKYLKEAKMTKSVLNRALMAVDDTQDPNALKHEVTNFYSDLTTKTAELKKLFTKAKSKPNLPEVQLFIVAFRKLEEIIMGNTKDDVEEEN
ncbi:hypothetical protein GW796_05500 [archaeon]|nr:hypothetical protein [archaeon]NCQ51339.1 hypothetical protein [archaeon]NCT58835.1 hypothetical protein [archaeon]PJB18493.1 MAG: hypothetical protein CO117_07960 [Flavobacteriaceae bacterium CG_4_9_14_3_um_filter_33_16]